MENVTRSLQSHDFLTVGIAANSGISKFKYYRYLKENGYEQISHGVYAAPDEWVDELYILYQRCPQCVFSHDEAFYYHGLTDREPLVHTLTMYSGYNAHRLTSEGHKVYNVKKELLEVGKTVVVDNCGNSIPMYDLERTVCDLIRSRNSIEAQDFNDVLKNYVKRKDKDLNKLSEYARLFRVDKILRKYLELLL